MNSPLCPLFLRHKGWARALFWVWLAVAPSLAVAQTPEVPIIQNLESLPQQAPGIHHYWLEMGTNTYGYPTLVPVMLMQGSSVGPCLGLTAAIHGNELNGIPIIHRLFAELDPNQLTGSILAIPGLNAVSIQLDRRRFPDEEDLNRNFPGKANGDESQQYVHKIKERILPAFDVLLDMHTASFGRINSLYVRADLREDSLRILASLQQPDLILNSLGGPSTGMVSSSLRTMRGEATLMGIPCVTIEYGDPQVFQEEMVERGLQGVRNTLAWLGMYGEKPPVQAEEPMIYCQKSYWIYMEEGGFLEVHVAVKQLLQAGEKIATVRNAFGEIIREYSAPEAGVVIGKSTNPTNMSGGRIIHLGILRQ
jgi:hypothetical protein